jgi:soluble lytic murein transglycosylase
MPPHLKWIPVLALTLLWAPFGVTAENSPAAADLSATRQAFVAAMQRIRLHLPDTPDSAPLEAYVIHDYLVAARLRRDLVQKPDEELDKAIDIFLQGHANQPVSRGLKHEWLLSLAQRRRWDWFLPRSADATDPVVVCDRLQGRLATGDTEGLSAAVLARWSLAQKQPDECNEAFAWLRQQNLETAAAAEAKVRAALAANNPRLARAFVADVPIARAPALLQWSDLLEAPKSALTVFLTHPSLPVEPEALVAGFERLAHTDSADALNLLPSLLSHPGLTPALQSQAQRAAALGAAYDHDPRALSAFDGMTADAVDGPVEEWRVRAALWVGDYRKALSWIEHMPANLAVQPRWRYWRARALEATSGSDAAAPFFDELSEMRDYYGYLAADRVHRRYNLNVRPSPDDPAAQAALSAEPGVIRAHELFACDMTDEAAAEWSAVVGSADPATKVQAAHVAARWGWYAESIAMLAQAAEWDDVRLRYPRPYPEAVADASKVAGVPADWILGVMRQESLYRQDAVSRADARGLMQMLPSTAAAVARRWHLAAPSRETLFDPPVAVTLGAAYLRELLDRYAGQLSLSLAAYNAGSASVGRWLPTKSLDADIWIENIPYSETRAYVQHILEHIVAFASVRDAAPPRLDTLLPPVEPASGGPPQISP